MARWNLVHRSRRKRRKRWLCITSIISTLVWKCSPQVTQQPNRWRHAFLIAYVHCRETWSNRWRNFSNLQTPQRRPKSNFCDAIRLVILSEAKRSEEHTSEL